MELAERIRRYSKIEAFRGRPLIVYATSTRPGVQAMMANDAVREFIDQIRAIEQGGAAESVDILLHSTGGDALAAWKLMSVLRERFDSVHVLVPYMAFSAATIFALGADEIVMHPYASLGPIDPQISVKGPDGSLRRFAFEDVSGFLRFLKEAGIVESAHLVPILEKLFSVLDPVSIGAAERASELATDVGARLLQMHMKGRIGRFRSRRIARDLNKSFFAHGDAVSRSRARELHLKIAKDDVKLEEMLWQAFAALESFMELSKPFAPLQHYLADRSGAEALKPQAPLLLPPNTPPEGVNQAWKVVLEAAVRALGNPGVEVGYSRVNAVIESPRLASEHRTEGSLTAARIAGGEVKLVATDRTSEWRQVVLPSPGS